MMPRSPRLATAILIALPATPLSGPAAALPLSGDHVPLVFGDSLSDPGNLFAAAIGLGQISGPLPQFPFNQITDGQTWASKASPASTARAKFSRQRGSARKSRSAKRHFGLSSSQLRIWRMPTTRSIAA